MAHNNEIVDDSDSSTTGDSITNEHSNNNTNNNNNDDDDNNKNDNTNNNNHGPNVQNRLPISTVDVHKGTPVRLQVKVAVPIEDHPNYNFVGKLLGPKGNSLKWLQERTQTRMAILGKGSMKNKQKEEELRRAKNPKFSHLNENLHVEITAIAPAPEAYLRISNALFEIKRFLVPDYFDEIRQQQLRELGVIPADTIQMDPPMIDENIHTETKIQNEMLNRSLSSSNDNSNLQRTQPMMKDYEMDHRGSKSKFSSQSSKTNLVTRFKPYYKPIQPPYSSFFNN